MSTNDRTPVVVATGQSIERDSTVSPVELAVRAAEVALGRTGRLRSLVDLVSMVNVFSGAGTAPATRLAHGLGLRSARTEVTTIGGNTPQWLVSRAATLVAASQAEAVLIAGAETQRSLRILRARGSPASPVVSRSGLEHLLRGRPDPGTCEAEEDRLDPDPIVGDDRPGAGPRELEAGLAVPVNVYALFESVIAHRAGRTFAEHRSALGELMAPFTRVAAQHPFAWFPKAWAPCELARICPENRLVSEPYPKRMCAMLGVDQGAAVVVTSLEAARAAGIADRAIFCWSGAQASDVWFPSARPDPGRSQGIKAAASAALDASRIGIDEVTAIDLYSCFPCVVEMAASALGIDEHDERGLTVTGGLPYFGGPGNNYTLHAIATMVDLLRDRGGIGLVTGLGWYATKHSVGVYGVRPNPNGWQEGDTTDAQRLIDASAVVVADAAEVTSDGAQEATVIASTVSNGLDGEPISAPVIARLDDGRHVALAADESDLPGLAGRSIVGERVQVSGSPPHYHVDG
jgi:acetyl-CoA C-acetyltransferase